MEGALLVAKFQYPELDENKVVQKIDAISKNIWIELNPALSALKKACQSCILPVIWSLFGQATQQLDVDLGYINNLLDTKRETH